MISKIKKIVLYFLFPILVICCTEPYSLSTVAFEDYLVVEATITNVYKKHEIKLTRTFPLESGTIPYERNATVYIRDNEGNTINFNQENNIYISETEFSAQANKNYTLHIKTNDGEEYVSENVQLTTATSLSSVNIERMNYYNVDGVAILANSYDPNNNTKFYRYEYEETSKIIAPYWSNDSLYVTGYNGISYEFDTAPRTSESRTCFKTSKSNEILQYSTTNQAEDRVTDFIVRFISKDNYAIANGFSILVKQYIQSPASYFYYKTLKEINASGEILSPKQPGFLYGNLSCISNTSKKVIGFFDISYYSETRVYFDYEDIFPNQSLPQFPFNCEINNYDATVICGPGIDCRYGNENLGAYTDTYTLTLLNGSYPTYNMVTSQCGDCRTIGSNIQPTFWP